MGRATYSDYRQRLEGVVGTIFMVRVFGVKLLSRCGS